jgi:hypothetical protein
MAYQLEVKYYNSFWLKQITTNLVSNSDSLDNKYVKLFPGVENLDFDSTTNTGFPNFPQPTGNVIPYSNVNPIDNDTYSTSNGSNYIIEESRIRGGYNNTQLDLGVRAYLKEDSNNVRHRTSSLVYSGIFNNRTNINNTNVFSIAEDITKTVDPHNGSIQLIHAMDNNLTILQENKVSQALIDKDAIYSAEGSPLNTTSNVVIGQVTPYVGDYGISRNPESFADFGFRRYFSDKDRNAIMRLSRDGLTEISQYGMKDYFRDEMAKISDKVVLFSSPYRINYNNSTGYITQGPFSLDPTSPLIETPLGNFVSLVVFDANSIDVEIGSQVQVNWDYNTNPDEWLDLNVFVTGVGSRSDFGVVIYLSSGRIGDGFLPQTGISPYFRFKTYEKDKIQGGFDNYKDHYVISLQKHSGSKTTDETSDYYNTLSFDDSVKGWTSFYTYRPGYVFSLKNNFYSTKNGSLYLHYDTPARTNPNNFYGVQNTSSITFIFNANPSSYKNFKTINYEGSTGWQVDYFSSDIIGFTSSNVASQDNFRDTSAVIKSYDEGKYLDKGLINRAGFKRKDNKYFANLINNSAEKSGEIIFGSSMTGIKGHFATVKLSTDTTTNTSDSKELFAVSTEFVISSR